MTVKELIEQLQQLPPNNPVADDEGRSVARVDNSGTLIMDRSEDN